MNLAIQGEVPMQGGLPTFPYSLRGSCNEIRHRVGDGEIRRNEIRHGVGDGEIDAQKYGTGSAAVKSTHKNTAKSVRL